MLIAKHHAEDPRSKEELERLMGEVKKQAIGTHHTFICLPPSVLHHMCITCSNDWKSASTHVIAGHTIFQNVHFYRAYITAFPPSYLSNCRCSY